MSGKLAHLPIQAIVGKRPTGRLNFIYRAIRRPVLRWLTLVDI